MARITQRELLIEAMEAIYQLAGVPVGVCAQHATHHPDIVRSFIREHAHVARQKYGEQDRQHSDVLTTLLSEVDLLRPGLLSVADKQALHDKAKKRLRIRRDMMHELHSQLEAIESEAWLVTNATAGDPPDHARLARARRAFVAQIEARVKPVRERIDAMLFGLDFDDEEGEA